MQTDQILKKIILGIGTFFSFAAMGESGTYEVPVSDPELAIASINEIEHISARINGRGEIRVDYPIPKDIVGESPLRNRIRGYIDENGKAEVSGPLSTGTCLVSQSTGTVECKMHMNDAFKEHLNPEVIAEQLSTRYSDNPTLASRKIAVMKAFSFDAIGILRFQLH